MMAVKNEPKLTPVMPILSASISGRLVSQSATVRAASAQPALLETVHAGDGDDHRHLGAGLIVRRQVENRRQRFAAIWQLDPFDVMVGHRHVLVEIAALVLVQL